jgi:hypothetical protein
MKRRRTMRRRLALALLVLWLVGCQSPIPDMLTLTPTTNGTPTATLAATPPPPQLMTPTVTSIAQGVEIRLATPDPSPSCPDHYPWFFDNRAQECADYLSWNWSVVQPFEHGLMVWSQEGGRTYILIEDGSLFKPYQIVTDTGGLYLPDPDPSLIPPSGFYSPVLGFAKFWRGLIPGSEWIRQRVGWATAPEVGYSALWQCNKSSGDAARCYFTGPHDEIIVITRGSVLYWNYWQGPVR